jgi:hypothetical protein
VIRSTKRYHAGLVYVLEWGEKGITG